MHPRTEPATKLQVFIPEILKREVDAAAAEAGQPLTVWVARALAAAVISFKAKEAAQ
jgi:predicted HicB family RNase H-like nuclease